jgi:hypothetical protein
MKANWMAEAGKDHLVVHTDDKKRQEHVEVMPESIIPKPKILEKGGKNWSQ